MAKPPTNFSLLQEIERRAQRRHQFGAQARAKYCPSCNCLNEAYSTLALCARCQKRAVEQQQQARQTTPSTTEKNALLEKHRDVVIKAVAE